MDLPIHLKYFKKLELFQELRKRDKENQSEWVIEKNILSWGAKRAHHEDLRTPLTPEMANGHQEITALIASDVDDRAQYIRNRLGNLVVMGYADDSSGGIVFTSDGFLAGEIVNELGKSPNSDTWYALHFYLLWIIFYSGALLVVANALAVLIRVLCFFFHHRFCA